MIIRRIDPIPEGLYPPSTKRVALYLRILIEDEKNNPLDSLVKQYRKVIETHPDWRLVQVFDDYHFAGSTMILRDGYHRLWDAISANKFDIVLTEKLHNLARNDLELNSLTNLLMKHKCQAILLDEDKTIGYIS